MLMKSLNAILTNGEAVGEHLCLLVNSSIAIQDRANPPSGYDWENDYRDEAAYDALRDLDASYGEGFAYMAITAMLLATGEELGGWGKTKTMDAAALLYSKVLDAVDGNADLQIKRWVHDNNKGK